MSSSDTTVSKRFEARVVRIGAAGIVEHEETGLDLRYGEARQMFLDHLATMGPGDSAQLYVDRVR